MIVNKASIAARRRNIAAGALATSAILMAAPGYTADFPAIGQPSALVPAPAAGYDWKLIVSPYAWATSLNGKASVLGIPARVDVPFSATLKDLRFALMGSAELTNEIFGVYINGQYADVGTSRTMHSIDIGAGMTTTMLGGGFYYRLFEARLGGQTVFGTARTFTIEPTAGVRWTQLTAKVKGAGHVLSGKESWADPFVGLRASIDLTERWNLSLEGDIGGFNAGSQLSLNGQAYIGYRTMLLGHNTVLRTGYRVLHQEYEAGGFKWDVTQHGPVVGVSMQF